MESRDLLDRSTAAARLSDGWQRPSETVTVGREAIAGRTVAAPVTATADVPAADFATMDGFAFRAEDPYPLTVVAAVAPADDAPPLGEREAVRVATGAPLPERADAVLPVEEATVTDGTLTGPALQSGTNRYPAGATASDGEVLFGVGTRLAPRHAALLADVGIDTVTVRRRLSVGVLATGTEIATGEQPDRDSELLANLVREWGHEPALLEPVADDDDAVRAAIEAAAADHDAVFTSGGTSAGAADFVRGVLADHDTLFSGVALRPGRPTTAALVDGTLVCALPGKPLAAHAAATLVARPALAGTDRLPTVSADPTCRVELPDAPVEYAVPVRLDDGRATPLGHEDSPFPLYGTRFAPGRVASSTRLTLTDSVVVTTDPLVPGTAVDVVPYEVVE
ncbi:molybdopterin-binding protein [Halorarius halobius]|uniref:molybdopterin-binding protein n=1 Tax=Halorarius halobius TaxID=2962671 RepID=UPI0020CF012F|nr:molybdopterin-binding protein [Halorarius halobius]